MSKKIEIVTSSIEETQEFAEKFAQQVKPGDIITLSGELGGGKTTFVQGFAKGLGITNRIISPTFIIVRSYEFKRKAQSLKRKSATQNLKTFYHIDLYRVESEKSLGGIGLKEILQETDAVIVIEWPERMGSMVPEKRWDIRIESLGESKRRISVEYIKNQISNIKNTDKK